MFALTNAGSNDLNVFFWLLVIATVVAMLGRYIRIPYALALVITGFIAGVSGLLPNVYLDPHLLFAILLPPLLFEAAINMQVKLLMQNWKAILIFALAGTLLATLASAFLAHNLLSLSLAAALVFGALISPTDPISVIAVFKEMRVGKDLSIIMEAESLFNDGVAIVLFTIMAAYAAGQNSSVLEGIRSFLVVFAGGAILGGAIGLIASRITREFNDHLLEIMLTTVAAFGSYLSAEWLHVSGVIAVAAAGLALGSYGMERGMSATTRLAVNTFWEYAAFAVNSVVFLLVGFEVTLVNIWPLIITIVGAFLIVLASRALAVYGLSPVLGLLGCQIPVRWQHVLVWGGLRGAIPMALALSLDRNFAFRNEIMVITFGVVLISLLVQGLSTKPLLKRLGLSSRRDWMSEHRRLASQILAAQEAIRELDSLERRKALSAQSYQRLRGRYLERLDWLENRIEELGRQDERLIQIQENQALRFALLSEKSSLQEAYRGGLIDDDDWRQLSLQIDEELDRLNRNLDGS